LNNYINVVYNYWADLFLQKTQHLATNKNFIIHY
jgi:hypothetical protein